MDPQNENGRLTSVASKPSAWTDDKPIDFYEAFELLKDNQISINKGPRKELPSTVAKAVQHVMSTDFTEMQSSKADRAIAALVRAQGANDVTVFISFWHALYNGDSQKKTNIDGVGILEDIEWSERGASINRSQEFEGPGLFSLDYNDRAGKRLASALSTPKPQITVGLHASVFTPAEMEANRAATQWAQLSALCWHSFLLFESQCGENTTIELAEVRALRAGSALVKANQQLKAEAGMFGLGGRHHDESTIVFSFCLTPSLCKLYVHWASIEYVGDESQVNYHMQQTQRYLPDEQDSWINMRQDLERILDWGTSSRLDGPGGVREILTEINAKSKHASKRTLHKAR
ncbi:MAG: hypothetical protein LQ341_003755 [Variospora aurantia]|nr:MAG: hypothetical protein LQ341_003755 [Variospora aurantia]